MKKQKIIIFTLFLPLTCMMAAAEFTDAELRVAAGNICLTNFDIDPATQLDRIERLGLDKRAKQAMGHVLTRLVSTDEPQEENIGCANRTEANNVCPSVREKLAALNN